MKIRTELFLFTIAMSIRGFWRSFRKQKSYKDKS